MNLEPWALGDKAELKFSRPLLPLSSADPKTYAARYLMSRFDLSHSMAFTIADLAKIGGAPAAAKPRPVEMGRAKLPDDESEQRDCKQPWERATQMAHC